MSEKQPTRIGELLFGIVALQKGYLSLPQMLSAVADRGAKGLADALIERGLLDPVRRDEVQAQVKVAVDASGGDEKITLQNLQTDQQMLLESLSAAVLDVERNTLTSQPTSVPEHIGLAPVFKETPGRYEWEHTEELGRGGVGRVVRIWDTSMGRDVAIKQLIHPAHTEKQRHALEARFLREARLTGQLDHPAVLPVYEVGRQDDGGLFYAMQRVRGRTLYDAIHGTPDIADRLKLMPHVLTACLAVAYAHSRGVVHRDLKPQNIMIGNYGETYVLDWGLARVRGQTDFHARERAMVPDLTGNVLEGRAIGTPAYMSPEQADGRFADIDERSDVWGLGSVLFELIARKPPFSGPNPIALLAKVREDDVVPVQTLHADAPPELCAIAMKCLNRDRAQRYPNAGAVAADIEAWLNDRRVSAHRYRALELFKRFVRQNQLAAVVAGASLVALVLGATVLLNRIQEERDAARELAQLFLEDVSQKLTPASGSRALLEELTTQTLQRYESRLDPLAGSREERLKLGWAWQRIGRLTYRVGKKDEAEHAFRYATRVADGLLGAQRTDAMALVLGAEARVGLSDVTSDRGDVAATEAQLREALARVQQAVKLDPELIVGVETESRVWSRLTDLWMNLGRQDEALEALRRSRDLDRRRMQLKPDDPKTILATGIGATQLGLLLSARGDLQGARDAWDECVTVAEIGLKKFPDNPELLSLYSYGATEVALYDRISGRAPRGIIEKGKAAMDKVIEEDPDNLEYLSQQIETLVELEDLPAAWRLSTHLVELDGSGEYLTSVLVGSFMAGHFDETLRLGVAAKGTSKFAGAMYAALSAGALGDWERAALQAARAKQEIAKKAALAWDWHRTQKAVAGVEGPGGAAIRKLCDAVDVFFVTAKDGPLLEALAEYQAFAEAQVPKH